MNLPFISDLPTLIEHSFFTINLLPILLLFSSRIEKRNYFVFRTIGGFLLCFLCSAPFSHGLFTYLLQFTLYVLFSFFIYRISVKEALYVTACVYAVQHICYCVYLVLFRPASGTPVYALPYLVCSLIIILLLYGLIGRNLPENGHFEVDLRFSLISFCIIILLVLGLSIVADNLYATQGSPLYYICKIYDLICCIFILWEQVDYKKKLKQQREHDIDQQLRLKQKELFRLRQDDVERINLICHDLKKQIESLKLFSTEQERQDYYDQIVQTIQSYDSQVETGSRVLDTLLSQKRLVCMKNQIELTCVADGQKMDFIPAVDLYTILGNVLDNAIESVLLLPDPEKKVISVSIWTKGNLLLIQVENYYENKNLTFADGLPVTTKNAKDGHGYGLRSVRRCVEKYHGSLDVSAHNNLFRLTIILPLPKTI